MAKKPRADEVEERAIDPAQLTYRCHEMCPEPMDCTLPTPWPPAPVPGATAAASKR